MIMIESILTIIILFINYFPNIITVINSSIPQKLDEYVAKVEDERGGADSTSVSHHKTMHSIQAAFHMDKQDEGSRKTSFRTAKFRKPKDILVWASVIDGLIIANGLVAVILLNY